MTEPGPGGSDRVERLIAGMSLRQRVGQINQRLLGWDCVVRGPGGYQLTERFTEEVHRWEGLGAVYGLFRADAWSGRDWENGIPPADRAEVADLVMTAVQEVSPFDVPPLLVEEAPHGHQALGGTLLPTNLTMAATWDPQLCSEAASAVAAELSASGVHLALVSALDILRDPRWGRAEESFGEDPLLAAELTRAVVEGMQGRGRSRLGGSGVGVTLKHFAAQGEACGGRNGQSAIIGPTDLADIHLVAARAGVEAGAVALMAAYTDIDGVPCCAHRALLLDLLRGEWGFDGVVMADGLAVDRLVRMMGTPAAAARLAVTSGVDLSLWDESFTLLERLALADENVRTAVDRAARAVLGLKERLGLLGPPERAREPETQLTVLAAQTRAASTAAAERGLVLLANDDQVLPLAPGAASRIAVLGPHADDPTCVLGDYVPPLPPDEPAATVLTALRDHLDRRGQVRGLPLADPPEEELRDLLRWADVVVVVLGGTSHRCYDDVFADNGAAVAGGVAGESVAGRSPSTCGEGRDLADITLPYGQQELVSRVRAGTNRPVIAVVVAGRPHVLTPVLDAADATVWAGYPGPQGPASIARLLFGEIEPTGRLPFTLPRSGTVVPVRYNDRHPAEGVYLDQEDPILLPFGFGLGYHQATVESLAATVEGQQVRVVVELGNQNRAEVLEPVQVYARRWGGPPWPRNRELVAFARVAVPPGTRRTVDLAVAVSRAFRPAGRDARTTLFCGPHQVNLRID